MALKAATKENSVNPFHVANYLLKKT